MSGGPLQKQLIFSLRFSLVEVEKSTENSGYSDEILNKSFIFMWFALHFVRETPTMNFFKVA